MHGIPESRGNMQQQMIDTIFDDGSLGDKIYREVEPAGAADWAQLERLLLNVCAGDRPLFLELEAAINAYAGRQLEAAFVCGVQWSDAIKLLTK